MKIRTPILLSFPVAGSGASLEVGQVIGAISGLIAAVAPGEALAHGDHTNLTAAWSFDPWIVIPLLLSGGLYVLGTVRLWRHAGTGRGIRPWQVGCYGAGWLLLAGALVSPLHWMGEHLFTAHMVEHEIIMACAAPLLALARPVGAFLWAFPAPLAAAPRAGRPPEAHPRRLDRADQPLAGDDLARRRHLAVARPGAVRRRRHLHPGAPPAARDVPGQRTGVLVGAGAPLRPRFRGVLPVRDHDPYNAAWGTDDHGTARSVRPADGRCRDGG